MTETNINVLRKKEGRGIFLLTILILQSILAIIFTIAFILELSGVRRFIDFNIIIQHIGIETFLIDLSIPLFSIISAFAIWRWSRIGLYLFIVLLGVWLIDYFTYWLPVDIKNAHLENVLPLIFITREVWMFTFFSCLYLWAIMRKWHLFF